MSASSCNSLAAYVLASYRRTDERSAEAGLKYFVLGALASGILLYGISLLYGFTGTTQFEGVAAAFARDGTQSIGLLFGLVFLLAGLAFKISAVPFHMWTPDVYEGAPTPVTAFFASAPKVAAVLLGVRVCLDALGAGDRRLAADHDLRRAGLDPPRRGRGLWPDQHQAAAGLFVDQQCRLRADRPGRRRRRRARQSVLFYMAVYVVMTLGAFLCVLRMKGENGEPLEAIDSLSGLSQTRPGLAVALAIFMFSLAGIPPLFGFWPKLMVFNAAVAEGLYPLAVAGILGTVVGAYLLPQDRQGDVHGRAGPSVRQGPAAPWKAD